MFAAIGQFYKISVITLVFFFILTVLVYVGQVGPGMGFKAAQPSLTVLGRKQDYGGKKTR